MALTWAWKPFLRGDSFIDKGIISPGIIWKNESYSLNCIL